MVRSGRLVFAVLVLVSGSSFAGDEAQAKKDLDALQGTWSIAALEANGVQVPAAKLMGTTLVVKGDNYAVTQKKNETKVTLNLDPSKDPKEVDMTFQDGANKDKVHKGIYRIMDKDHFQVCRGLTPEQARPAEFATWPDTNYFVITWKRNK